MKLAREDYEFNNTQICHIMPKHIELDRVLINLYMLLKHNGKRPVTRSGRKEVDVDYLVEQLLQQHAAELPGFADHQDVVRDWVYSDLVDMVYRGIPDKEAVAAPLPLHLNAYKLRNPKQAKDYRAAEHLFSMLCAGDSGLISRLAAFLGQGMDASASYDTYDRRTPLDLDTLMIVRMVDAPNLKDRASSEPGALEPPLCLGQARMLAADVRVLLAYEHVIPRRVLIGYLRTALGLHLGLYLLRLFRQVSGWVRDAEAHPACLNCPVNPNAREPFSQCPYAFQNQDAEIPLPELLVDMGEDYTSHLAELARENCDRVYAQMNDYIQAVFVLNQVKRFAVSDRGRRHLPKPPESVGELAALLRHPSEALLNFFSDRLDDLVPSEMLADEREAVRAIYEMQALNSLQRFVELIALERTRYYRKYLTEQIDTVLMKNQETCLLRQGKGRHNERRWHIGSQMLEMLVQIAVVQPEGSDFRSRPIRVNDLLFWLRQRYGLTLMPEWPAATIQDYEAFNVNLRILKRRLREIGFYTDLSDAYNAQIIRPRYEI